MKWYRKINRGFAALVLILLILLTYRIVLSQSRSREEPDLKRLTEDYLATAIDLEFIPADLLATYKTAAVPADEFMKTPAYKEFYDKAKASLAPFYPEDGRYLGFQMYRLEERWAAQLNAGSTLDLDYTLQRYDNIRFLDNGVTVEFQIDYIIDGNSQFGFEDIYFEKSGSEWKVLASDFDTRYFIDMGRY